MPDLTIEFPDALLDRLQQIADEEGIAPETLVRHAIALKVGVNPSSMEKPISVGFLTRQTHDVLHVGTNEPVHFIDGNGRKFVLVSAEYYDDHLPNQD